MSRQKKVSNSIFLWILLVSFSILCSLSAVLFAGTPQGGVVYDAKGKRDPFEPLVSGGVRTVSGLQGVQTVEDIHIEGIVVDPLHGSYVVANGVVLAEGASESDVKALQISEEGVLFEIRGRRSFKPFEENKGEGG